MKMDKTVHSVIIVCFLSECVVVCQAVQVPAVQLFVHSEGEHAAAPQGEARGAGRRDTAAPRQGENILLHMLNTTLHVFGLLFYTVLHVFTCSFMCF